MEWYACVKYADDNMNLRKDHFVPISLVFFNKNDSIPIQPVNFDDYDFKNKYYILWDSAKNERHPGYIRCIDESKEKCKLKASQTSKRMIFPKQFTSTESDDDRVDQNDIIPEKMAKVCRKFAQKESHEQVKTIYNKNLLMKNRTKFTVHENDSSIDMQSSNNDSQVPNSNDDSQVLNSNNDSQVPNSNDDSKVLNSNNDSQVPSSNNNSQVPKDFCVKSAFVNVEDCLQSNAKKTKDLSILTDNSSNILPVPDTRRCAKARKTFPPRTSSTLQTVINSKNNDTDKSDNASPRSSIHSSSTSFSEKMGSFRRRFARLRSVGSFCTSPRRNVSVSPRNLFNDEFAALSSENEQDQQTLSPSASVHIQTGGKQPGQGSSASSHSRPQSPNLPNLETGRTEQDQSSPRSQPQNTAALHGVQNSRETDEEIDENDNDGLEDDTDCTQCKTLRDYKLQLYRLYKAEKFDMISEVPEEHTRYEVLGDMVYLGLGRTAGVKSWRMSKSQKYTTFLRDLSSYLWRERKLAHRCLDLKKLKSITVPGGGDIVLCSPRKLDLYLSIFQDYLNENRCYKNLTDNEKDVMMKNSTETLSVAIRDARFHFINKKKRRRTV